MQDAAAPELSVIVPVLNEAKNLPGLFRMLAGQQAVALEMILCDGGSTDETLQVAARMTRTAPFPCRIVPAPCGRGRQLNAGAAAAQGKELLFLHADSGFTDPRALHQARRFLADRLRRRGDDRAAGRFALRFRRPGQEPSLAYYFYECKARLDRPGCIHGDQGFLLRRSFFQTLGPFAESLPVLEDDRMADRVRQTGEWLLLPAEIHTSPRRFDSEGLRERQTLNALLMNFAAIGCEDFLPAFGDAYRCQSRTARLQILPVLDEIHRLLDQLPWRRRLTVWYMTGAYVRGNAWQLALLLGVRRHYREGLPPGQGEMSVLEFFDRWLDPLINHPPGDLAAAVLTRCWFLAMRRRLRRQAKRAAAERRR